jgi:hypothetical protein
MISKKTTISTIIALTALALISSPSVLTLGSVYALDFGSGNGGNFVKDFFDTALNGADKSSQNPGNNDKTTSGGNDEKFVKDFFDTALNGADKSSQNPGKNDKASSDSGKSSDPRKPSTESRSSTDSNQPCKQDNSQKGTHFYCEGTHHHCKPGPDNPKCVKT